MDPGGTVGERRRKLCARGHTPEQIADADRVDLDSVKRSMRPAAPAKDADNNTIVHSRKNLICH